MAFRKQQQSSNKKHPDGRISLWEAPEGKRYILSGSVEINGVRYRAFIFENEEMKNPRSPHYTGSLFMEIEEEEAKPVRPKTTKIQPQYEEDDEDSDNVPF